MPVMAPVTFSGPKTPNLSVPPPDLVVRFSPLQIQGRPSPSSSLLPIAHRAPSNPRGPALRFFRIFWRRLLDGGSFWYNRFRLAPEKGVSRKLSKVEIGLDPARKRDGGDARKGRSALGGVVRPWFQKKHRGRCFRPRIRKERGIAFSGGGVRQETKGRGSPSSSNTVRWSFGLSASSRFLGRPFPILCKRG